MSHPCKAVSHWAGKEYASCFPIITWTNVGSSISYVNTKLGVCTCVLGILSVGLADMQSTIARLSFRHAELPPVAICPIYGPPVASVITANSSGGFGCEMHTTPYPLHTTYVQDCCI